MEHSKRAYFALVLYSAALIMLTVIITFGLSWKINLPVIDAFREFLDAVTPERPLETVPPHSPETEPETDPPSVTPPIPIRIDDVQISLDLLGDPLLAGKAYAATYTAVGSIEGDPGLQFEALDDVFSAFDPSSGAFTFRHLADGETELVGRIRITSRWDREFEKTLTLRAAEKYPDSFAVNYLSRSVGYNASVFVGVPLHTYILIPEDQTYTAKNFELVYDPEYLRLEGDTVLVPIKETPEGEQITFSARMPNGTAIESRPFSIAPSQAPTSFSGILLYSIREDILDEADGRDWLPSQGGKSFYLLDGEGNRCYTDYEVLVNGQPAEEDYLGRANFNAPGDYTLTVRLPNGFEKSTTVSFKNVMSLPTVSSNACSADGVWEIRMTEPSRFSCSFPEDVTYKKISVTCDNARVTLTRTSATSFSLIGKVEGDTTVTILLDDGDQRLEKTYTVRVLPIETISGAEIFEDTLNVSLTGFVGKIFGHAAGFALLALLAANFFRFVKTRRWITRFLLYSSGALAVAALTELIQCVMPGRSARLSDVLLDMAGFYVGTLLIALVALLVRGLQRLLRKRSEKTQTE